MQAFSNEVPVMRSARLIFALCLFTSAAAWGQEDQQAAARRQARDQQKQFLNNVPLRAGSMKLSELVKITLVNGKLNPIVGLELTNGRQERLKIDDAPGLWMGYSWGGPAQMGGGGIGIAPRSASIMFYDLSADGDDFWQVALQLNDQGAGQRSVSISAQGINGAANFSQYQDNVALYVNSYKNNQQVFSANARSVSQLMSEHPKEVRKYLMPLLSKFGGGDLLRPGATDVYRVFTQIPADPAVAEKLAAILTKLDSPDSFTRQTGSTELAALGRPAVLAVLRLGEASLTPEQRSRLDGFLSDHSHWAVKEPQQARGDLQFLVDSLEDDDAAVRSAAKAAIEGVTGAKLDFDPNMPADKRPAAVDALRGKLLKK